MGVGRDHDSGQFCGFREEGSLVAYSEVSMFKKLDCVKDKSAHARHMDTCVDIYIYMCVYICICIYIYIYIPEALT